MEILCTREHTGYCSRGFGNIFGSKSKLLENLKCIREDQHLIEGISNEDIVPPLACRFNEEKSSLVAIANEDGGITLLDTHFPGFKGIREEWRAHENAIFDIEWAGNQLLTASGDQTAKLWDVPSEKSISTFKGHASSVKTIRCAHDCNVFATGARDGHIMVWDARVKAKGGYIPAMNTIQNAHMIQPADTGSATKKKRQAKNQQQHNSQQSVTAVVFQDEHTLISSGSVDGSVKLWDLRKNYSILKSEPIAIHTFPYAGKYARSHGFSSLALDSTKTRLFANCMDNTIYLYDCAGLNTKPVATYTGHTNSSFYVKTALSPDDMFLLSGSTNKNAYIWRVDEPHRSPLELRGHTDEVSAVAWSSSDYITIMTLSDDCTLFTWRPHCPGARATHEDVTQQVIGSAEWTTKDIGVGAGQLTRGQWIPSTPSRSTNSPASSPLTTPHRKPKRTGITPEAVGLSPHHANHRSTGLSGVVGLQGTSQRLLSSTSVFTNKAGSSGILQSPLKSPKHINVLLSPRKTPIAGHFDALSPRKTPVGSNSAMSSPAYTALVRSVKRKLCDDGDDISKPAKRVRPDPSIMIAGVAPLGSSGQPFTPTENITPSKGVLQNTDLTNTMAEKALQSPTINLPNFVLNPQPRTPQPYKQKENIQKNWLVEIRQRKEAEKLDLEVDTTSQFIEKGTLVSQVTPLGKGKGFSMDTPGSKVTPKRKGTPSCQVTPRRTPGKGPSSKKPKNSPNVNSKNPTSRRSILSYFSPKDSAK